MSDSTEQPRISVIVPSYNGAKRIPNVLAALAAQTVPPHEVILSIDGSTDNSEEIARGIQLPCTYTVHVQPNGGRAAARNAGARLATGNVLLFLDDDMRPTPTVVAGHMAFHAAHPYATLVGGQQQDPDRCKKDFELYTLRNNFRYLQGTPTTLYQDRGSSLYITAAHTSIAAQLFWDMGGFDERLTDLEDLVLCAQLRQHGHYLWRDESLLAWHDSWDSPQHVIRRQRDYAAARLRLFELLPDLMRTQNVQPVQRIKGIRRLAMSLLARRLFLRRVGKVPFTWLPLRIRFILYDYIIFGLGLHFQHRPYS